MDAKKPPKRVWLCWHNVYEDLGVFKTRKEARRYACYAGDQVLGPYVLETRPTRKAKAKRKAKQ
jgi:hypothetical protein